MVVSYYNLGSHQEEIPESHSAQVNKGRVQRLSRSVQDCGSSLGASTEGHSEVLGPQMARERERDQFEAHGEPPTLYSSGKRQLCESCLHSPLPFPWGTENAQAPGASRKPFKVPQTLSTPYL